MLNDKKKLINQNVFTDVVLFVMKGINKNIAKKIFQNQQIKKAARDANKAIQDLQKLVKQHQAYLRKHDWI